MAHEVLRTFIRLLGGGNAWVTRLAGQRNHAVLRLGSDYVVDLTVDRVLMNTQIATAAQPVLLMPWISQKVLCASLSYGYESEGSTFMLSFMLNHEFILSDDLAALVEGMRCSLQALIGRRISRQRQDAMDSKGLAKLAGCTACKQAQAASWPGWSYCDFRFLSNL